MSWVTRLANAFRPGKTAADLDQELQFHLDRRIADLLEGGVPLEEAERIARQQFGNPTRDARIEPRDQVCRLARIAVSRFPLRPAHALEIPRPRASPPSLRSHWPSERRTAAFSLIDALMLRPLPVRDPHQLFDLARVFPPFMSPNNQPREFDQFSYPQFKLLRDVVRDSADLFLMQLQRRRSSPRFSTTPAERAKISVPSPSTAVDSKFSALKPAIRTAHSTRRRFSGDGHMVAVISYLSGNGASAAAPPPSAVRSRSGDTFEIIGVTSPSFSGV